MNKLKKMMVVTTGTALVAGLAFGVATQTADAAAKKYTVTVKYVGDDKKTLKTVKKTLKAGTKYKLAKLSTKDKAARNYAYKTGVKTIKVTKNATHKVTYKRTAYDVKFVIKKSDQAKAATVVRTVKKGATLVYKAPAVSWYTNTSAKNFKVKPTKDITYTLNYKRQFKFIINFVDVNGNTIKDRTYSNHTPVPSKTVTVLDGSSLKVTLPDNAGALAGWNISANGYRGNGIQDVKYLTMSGDTGYVSGSGVEVVNGNQLISNKIANSGWSELRERALRDGTVTINVNYAPNLAYWQKQFYTQSDSTVDKVLKNSGISGLTGVYKTAIDNLKNTLHEQMNADQDDTLLDTISQTSGTWNYVMKAWSEGGVKITKLAKATSITSNDSYIRAWPNEKINVGLDYAESYSAPTWQKVYGDLDLTSVKAYFTVTTAEGTYFIVQDNYGQVGFAKKAKSPTSDTDFYAK